MSGHGGNVYQLACRLGCRVSDILDFSANVNPLGPPEYLWNVLAAGMQDIVHYPDPEAGELVRAIARTTKLDPKRIVVGNGTSELLFAAVRILQPERAILPVPSYIDYGKACELAQVPVQELQLEPESGFRPDLGRLAETLQPGDLVIIGQPNNPTGRMVDRNRLVDVAQLHPDSMFLVDEAFAGFVERYRSLAGTLDNIVVLSSLTKLFAVPGLRLGYLSASVPVSQQIRNHLAPWSVNTLAQSAGAAMVEDQKFVHKSAELVRDNRQTLCEELRTLPGLTLFPSSANYLLLRMEGGRSAPKLAETLLQKYRIAVRVCGNYQGLDARYFRIAVRQQEDNEQLVAALSEILLTASPAGRKRKKTGSLMLVGTGSDVGKSVLAAGLCRVLLQDGVRVAPFKAQNMSLNSYVTRDGGEMGRAQVVQAQACRLDPDVRMNPVLLKPSSDVGSQVIVHGRPVGNMRVTEYVDYKQQAWQEVCRSYQQLAGEFDCIILEGAGSPGEVNLKSHDIVNMRMARFARSPALLVGDIDRGGVYASFIGHLEVMAPWERALLSGFVVNRFRGDATLLADAHQYLLARTSRPVLGVIPYLDDLGLPQEDSVSFKAGLYDSERPGDPHVQVVLVDLPHISNFTDLEPLLEEPDVHLRVVRRDDTLGSPDCIILPGTKNVVADLGYLAERGLAADILNLAAQGVEIIGICGGYQMLGRTVYDPHGLEGEPGSRVKGLGLLDLETELAAVKTLVRKKGLHILSGQPVHGYEIHHGRSRGHDEPVLRFSDGASCGRACREGRVWGSYLHGIFDSDPFRRWLINRLRAKRGLAPYDGPGASYDLEPALDRLAGVLRQRLDMDRIYELLGL